MEKQANSELKVEFAKKKCIFEPNVGSIFFGFLFLQEFCSILWQKRVQNPEGSPYHALVVWFGQASLSSGCH